MPSRGSSQRMSCANTPKTGVETRGPLPGIEAVRERDGTADAGAHAGMGRSEEAHAWELTQRTWYCKASPRLVGGDMSGTREVTRSSRTRIAVHNSRHGCYELLAV